MTKLLVFKATWGMDESLPEAFKRIAEAGYDGLEGGLPAAADKSQFKELLQRHRLQFIPMIFTGGPDHVGSFESQLGEAASYQPLKVTAHSAKDYHSHEEHRRFFKAALDIEKALGVRVAHETHRGRALYSPWNTALLLQELPSLRLNADFSHWCCVSESLMEDIPEMMALACNRSIHIHGRLGHEEGPQVGHPADPQWHRQLQRHESWWAEIIQNQRLAGEDTITFTPEFGPPNYMPVEPFTDKPVSDLWEVCLYMADRFRKRFTAGFTPESLP